MRITFKRRLPTPADIERELKLPPGVTVTVDTGAILVDVPTEQMTTGQLAALDQVLRDHGRRE